MAGGFLKGLGWYFVALRRAGDAKIKVGDAIASSCIFCIIKCPTVGGKSYR